MGYEGETNIGGVRERFLTTHWSLIEDIKEGQDEDRTLIGSLLEQYWKPVYCYLRRKGNDNEQAKDLTQAFFHEIVLNRNLVTRADQSKGRFRSFLLHALQQYTSKQALKARAQKRIPREKLVSLELIDPPTLPSSLAQASVEDSYHYAWVSALLERVIVMVRTQCLEQGLDRHWDLFSARVVQPILTDQRPPGLSSLCEIHSIEDTQVASNMIATVKRRFRTALIESIRRTLLDGEKTTEELADILQFFPKTAEYLP